MSVIKNSILWASSRNTALHVKSISTRKIYGFVYSRESSLSTTPTPLLLLNPIPLSPWNHTILLTATFSSYMCNLYFYTHIHIYVYRKTYTLILGSVNQCAGITFVGVADNIYARVVGRRWYMGCENPHLWLHFTCSVFDKESFSWKYCIRRGFFCLKLFVICEFLINP